MAMGFSAVTPSSREGVSGPADCGAQRSAGDGRGGIRFAIPPYALEPVTVEQTDHYKVMREFCDDPAGFVEAAIEE
jgi:hypothetical protein